MSANISYVNDESFQDEVLNKDGLVVVDFYAEWCMPCKMLGPILEEVADSNLGKIKVVKLNVDNAQATSSNYGVMGVPSMIFFKNGQEVERVVGLRGKEDIQTIIDSLI